MYLKLFVHQLISVFNVVIINIRGLSAVVGGFLIHLTLGGTLYSFGNLMTYMTSYMHFRVDFDITYAVFIWVNAAIMSSQGLFSVVGGKLDKKIGPKLTCLIGCITMCGGIFMTHFGIKHSIFYVILSYGFLTGAGIGIAYIAPLGCGMEWFPYRKGLVTGFIVGGFGLGASLTTPLETYILNPDNIAVGVSGYFEDDAILDRVPGVFKKLTIVYSCMQIIGCILVSKPNYPKVSESSMYVSTDDQTEFLLEGVQENTFNCIKRDDNRLEGKDWTTGEMIRNKFFTILFCIYVSNSFAIGFVNTLYKTLGQSFIKNDHFLSTVGAVASVYNCFGRIFWGYYMDNTSFRKSMFTLTFVLMFLIVSLPGTYIFSDGSAFALCIYLIFFTFSGNFVLMATAVEKAYGSKHYTANYGVLFLSQAISGPLIAGTNELFLENIGYQGLSYFTGFIVFFGMVMTYFIPKNI